jgi:hypothetical protein
MIYLGWFCLVTLAFLFAFVLWNSRQPQWPEQMTEEEWRPGALIRDVNRTYLWGLTLGAGLTAGAMYALVIR